MSTKTNCIPDPNQEPDIFIREPLYGTEMSDAPKVQEYTNSYPSALQFRPPPPPDLQGLLRTVRRKVMSWSNFEHDMTFLRTMYDGENR